VITDATPRAGIVFHGRQTKHWCSERERARPESYARHLLGRDRRVFVV
jgi:hypothetical protein